MDPVGLATYKCGEGNLKPSARSRSAQEETERLESSIPPVYAAHRVECHVGRELEPSIDVDEHVLQPDPSRPLSAADAELAAAVDLHQRGKDSDALQALYTLCRGPHFQEFSPTKQTAVYNWQGGICRAVGSNLRAVHCYVSAIHLCEDINDEATKCSLLGVVADLLNILKNYDSAILYYHKQMQLALKINDSVLHITGMLRLAYCHMFQDNYEEAIAIFRDCLGMYCNTPESAAQHREVAKTCLSNLGICQHQVGAYESAEDAFESCLQALTTNVEDALDRASVKVHLACTLLMRQQYTAGVAAGMSAITDFRAYKKLSGDITPSKSLSIEQLESRAYVWIQMCQLKQRRYVDSICTLETANSRVWDKKNRDQPIEKHFRAVHRTVITILTQMNRPLFIFQAICLQGFPHHLLIYAITPTQYGTFNMRVRCMPLSSRNICDIRQWILMSRFNVGMDTTFRSRCKSHPNARGKERAWGEPPEMEYSCLRPVRGKEFEGMEVNTEKYFRVAARNRFKTHENGELILRPRPHSAMQPTVDGTPFLEYDIDATVTFEACIAEKVYVPKPETYAYMLKYIGPRKSFRLGNKVFEACREMYDILLGCFDRELSALPRGTEIILMPLGPLAMVPFPCLQNKDEKYLIDSFRLRHLSSLVLTWQLSMRKKIHAPSQISDLTPLSPLNLTSRALRAQGGLTSCSLWRKICLVGKTRFTRHANLTGADQEVFLIEQLMLSFGVICRSYGVDGPTREDLKAALKDSSLIHIATHGSSHFIVCRNSEDDEDYEFCSDDLFKIRNEIGPFAPELVVLNTCSGSQFGDSRTDHLDTASIAHAFQANGVRCVVNSNTRVEDSISQELMTRFYNGLLGSTSSGKVLDVVEALQASLLHQSMKRPTDPSCWAGYTVTGFVGDITD